MSDLGPIDEQLTSLHWLLEYEQLRRDIYDRLRGVDGQFHEVRRLRQLGLPDAVWVYDERSLLDTVVAIARESETRGIEAALKERKPNNG